MASPWYNPSLPRFSVDDWLVRRNKSTCSMGIRTLSRSSTRRSEHSHRSLLNRIEPILDESTSQWIRVLFDTGLMRVNGRPETTGLMEKEAVNLQEYTTHLTIKQSWADKTFRDSRSSNKSGRSHLLAACNSGSPDIRPSVEIDEIDNREHVPTHDYESQAPGTPTTVTDLCSPISRICIQRNHQSQQPALTGSQLYQSLNTVLRMPQLLKSDSASNRHPRIISLDRQEAPAGFSDEIAPPGLVRACERGCDHLVPPTCSWVPADPAPGSLNTEHSSQSRSFSRLQEDRFELPTSVSSSSSLASKSGSSTSSLKPDYAPTWTSSALYRSRARPDIAHGLKHSLSSGWQAVKIRAKACKQRIARTGKRDH